ncbi:hypothetical protein AB832_02590 [Flavobacteriaceae bacterium (ex Bugula neritina AB1)]|nr:hypothetical protein AB832_02590 [Flavobacteriaceae bacterium (ex Bugula neritina AB1)]
MKAIIIDDELNAIRTLRNYIHKYTEELEVLGEARNKEDAIDLIDNSKFDVLFLDINLGGATGFDVLDCVKNKDYNIVCTTAFDEYAIKAFKYAAIHFLLKPIDPDEFMETIARLKTYKKKLQKSKQLTIVKESLKQKKVDKIAISSIDEFIFIKTKNIIRLESYKNYTDIYMTSGKKNTASKTLKHFEEILPKSSFLRVHQCHVVNINYVAKFVKKDGGQIVLNDETNIPVSRRKKEELIDKLR